MGTRSRQALSISKYLVGSNVTLVLSGSIDAKACTRLGPECAKWLERDYQLMLDLSEVRGADKTGIELLIALWDFGVKFVNLPSSIAFSIEGTRGQTQTWIAPVNALELI